MDRKSLQLWLDKYVEAWRTYYLAHIGELFSEDALYFYSPWDEDNPVRGREAIVADWRKEPDPSGSWEANYVPVAVEGNVGVVQGRTAMIFTGRHGRSRVQKQISRSTSMKLDAANVFTEWYMQPRSAQQAAT